MSSLLFKNIMCFGVLWLMLFSSSSTDIQRKIISNDEGHFMFYVAVGKEIKTHHLRTYFWYRSGAIHHSTGGVGGEVLHGEYLKYFDNQQLAEKGEFYYGLKDGVWKSWHPNGHIAELFIYKKGMLDGRHLAYNTEGKLIANGKYHNGLKSGKWIDYKGEGDTLFYKKGFQIKKAKTDSLDTLKRKPFGFVKRWSSWTKHKLSSKKDSLNPIDKEKKEKAKRTRRQRRKDIEDER